jgi:hypothetical protein
MTDLPPGFQVEKKADAPALPPGFQVEARNPTRFNPSGLPPSGDLPPGERFRQGVGDIGQGVVKLINHLSDGALEATRNPGGYDQMVADQQAGFDKRRAQAGGSGFDMARMGGNVAGILPAVAAIPAGEGIGGAIALGGIGGAISGALSPSPNAKGEDFWSEKAKDVAIGAGLGTLTGGAVRGVGNVVSPVVTPEVRTLTDAGVRPTIGQIAGGAAKRFEDKARSIPFVGDMVTGAQRRSVDDLNRAVYNQVLEPIGAQVAPDIEIGRAGVDAVENTLSQHYDALLPRITFQVDQQLSSDVAALRTMANGMPPQQAARFEQIVTDRIGTRLAPNGQMDGQTFKLVESDLSYLARGYRSSQDPDVRELGNAVQQLTQTLRESLERTNPALAPDLQAANSAWARFIRLQKAAGSLGSDNGAFTPAQLQSAVKASDASVRKGAFARGDALMQPLADAGKRVLGNNYPDSGTPGRVMAALLTGGAVTMNPLAGAGMALGALPYTQIGQRAMAAALAGRRPAIMQGAGELIRRGAVPAGAGAASLAPQQ